MNDGVDMEPGAGTGRPKDEWETGAFQVSANSMKKDPSLSACVKLHAGAADTQTFLDAMKFLTSAAAVWQDVVLYWNSS